MLVTTIAFVLLAAVLIWNHLRRSRAPAPAGAAGRCPRCGARVPEGAALCPGCRVPQQVFALASVGAAARTDEEPPPAKGARPHALVRADVCVGCGTCVAACPVPGAITLRAKLAVVDTALCEGHAECVAACPTSAIVISTGRAVHRVEVPDVDINFQTNVPGVYVVGELGGRGLIKNAINEGKVAIEHVASQLPPGAPRADGSDDAYDVVIVGSGPAGLSAALEAHRVGLHYVVLEQGALADTVRKYPRHKFLLAEPLRLPLYGDLWVADSSKETLLAVWDTIVSRAGLRILTHHRVVEIRRDRPFHRVETSAGPFLARRVVLAMGRRGSPRRLDVPGEELGKVFYDVAEMSAFEGRRVLVVGGGDSAIESALGLCNQPGTRVVLSYRGSEFSKLQERNRVKIESALAAGRLQLLLRSTLRAITPTSVDLFVDGEPVTLPNDDVIVRIGGDPPYPFLQRIGVRLVTKDIPLNPGPAGA